VAERNSFVPYCVAAVDGPSLGVSSGGDEAVEAEECHDESSSLGCYRGATLLRRLARSDSPAIRLLPMAPPGGTRPPWWL
jgi:hypothetical protein